eukprot:9497601-Pyramimonas_sp.AAC.1
MFKDSVALVTELTRARPHLVPRGVEVGGVHCGHIRRVRAVAGAGAEDGAVQQVDDPRGGRVAVLGGDTPQEHGEGPPLHVHHHPPVRNVWAVVDVAVGGDAQADVLRQELHHDADHLAKAADLRLQPTHGEHVLQRGIEHLALEPL